MKLSEVARHVEAKPEEPLGHIDFFAPTWQCSHVRFCRSLFDADDYSRESLLAWVLERNAANYLSGWADSLSGAEVVSVPTEEISSTLKTVAEEIENSDHLDRPNVLPVNPSELLESSSLFKIKGLELYQYGPAAVYIWERFAEFNYLELHYES